jgi:hypothetical protein
VVGGREGGFLLVAFSWAGIGVVGGADGGFSFGAFSWTGIGVVSGGDDSFSFGALSWTGIGIGGGDGRFLFGAFSRAAGRAAKFWKYMLQVVDSSMRRESRCAEGMGSANTGLINVFQICSSTAFGLASPPVSLKPARLNHCRERETNPQPSLSHCAA